MHSNNSHIHSEPLVLSTWLPMTRSFLIRKKYNHSGKESVMGENAGETHTEASLPLYKEKETVGRPKMTESFLGHQEVEEFPEPVTHWWFWGSSDLSSTFFLLFLFLFPTHGYIKRFLFWRFNFSKFDHLKLHYCLSFMESVWPLLDLRAAEYSWDKSSLGTWLEYHGRYQSGVHINFFLSVTVDASWLFHVPMNNDVWCYSNHMTWRKSLPISKT